VAALPATIVHASRAWVSSSMANSFFSVREITEAEGERIRLVLDFREIGVRVVLVNRRPVREQRGKGHLPPVGGPCLR